MQWTGNQNHAVEGLANRYELYRKRRDTADIADVADTVEVIGDSFQGYKFKNATGLPFQYK